MSKIGAGGMGEVWKGTDTRLDRDVAIKVLPAEFASDAQFRIRFDREAKTISQLSHPHICVLHDVGRQVVADSGAVDYLVMELLEGETLATRIERGPLPIEQVLRIGEQIAEALEAAHRKGVVHRDLKPGNVMLTKSGAKLLDFGLARPGAIAPWSGAHSATMARSDTPAERTEHKALTAEGTIVGTFQYMAPEQLEGASVDARTDIFALGAVLYEMATGRRAFDGRTKTSIIAAIVDRDPTPMQQIQPLTPPLFEHLVSRCLAKDPTERWQSAHDVARELAWIREAGSNAGTAVAITIKRKHREAIAWTVAAAALAAMFVALFLWRQTQNAPPPRVMRFAIPGSGARLHALYGLVAVSPDGSQIVTVASDKATMRLFRRSIDKVDQVPIEGTEGGRQPFFSPDGKWIAFVARHKLMKVALSGGQPIVLATASESRGGVWADDDTIYFCPFYYGGIERVPAAGGPAKAVSVVDRAHGERSHRWPHLLPGGKVLLYSVGRGGSWDDATIVAQRIDTGERKTLIEGGCDARYLPTGHLVYVRGTSLYAVPFDVKKIAVSGQPVEIAQGVANNTAGAAEFAFTESGMLVHYSVGAIADEGGALAMLNARGEKEAATLPPFDMYSPRFSPDGRKIVGSRRGNEVWSADLVRGTTTRLTSGARTVNATWSSDGTRVYYSSERNGPWNPFWQDADGGGAEHSVVKSDESLIGAAVSPDGQQMLVEANRKETGADIDILTIGDGRLRAFARTEATEQGGVFSPDGKWIAYESDESGRAEIYVRSASGSPGRWQISVDGGGNARWIKPAEIVYQHENKLMTVAVQEGASFSVAKPQMQIEHTFSDYDVAKDGRIIVVEPAATESGRGQINVVLNWFEEIRAKTGGAK